MALCASEVQLDMEITMFEALYLGIASPHCLTTLLSIYRPVSAPLTGSFFDEITSVLESVVTRNSQLVILGNFNIHLENLTESTTVHCLDLLTQFGLC